MGSRETHEGSGGRRREGCPATDEIVDCVVGDLPPAAADAVRAHLMQCPDCLAEYVATRLALRISQSISKSRRRKGKVQKAPEVVPAPRENDQARLAVINAEIARQGDPAYMPLADAEDSMRLRAERRRILARLHVPV